MKNTPCRQSGNSDIKHCKYCEAEDQKLNSTLLVRLVPLAKRLMRQRGDLGSTVGDLRVLALKEGVMTGREDGGTLSGLGHVFRRAGGIHIRMARRSQVPVTHGIHNIVWFPDIRVHPQMAE